MINTDKKIGFIGAGNMASALISGLVNAGNNPNYIMASSPEDSHLKILSSKLGIKTTKNNKEVANQCNILLVAVKPNLIKDVLKDLYPFIDPANHLLISIAAGVKIEELEKLLKPKQRIIRAMPNTPASIQKGVTALSDNSFSTPLDNKLAEGIFDSVGVTCWLEESSLDLYTALIGSGPAYIFYIIEALLEASEGLEFKKKDKKNLLIDMIIGSAQLAKTSDDEPKILREKVTSLGGVTERAIEVFEENRIRELIVNAIKEAKQRSIDLGNK